jgi:O-succinylbenzoate synthase
LPFKQPLITHHGSWQVRDGIILRVMHSDGRVGWGEIAPLPAFGSESLEQALAWCHALPDELSEAAIAQIPPELPACQFGFESAWETLMEPEPGDRPNRSRYSTLLPTGAAALQAWQPFWQAGSRTFKWKIGVAPIQQELLSLEKLVEQLPDGTYLRLDANGGLDGDTACRWLQACDRYNADRPRIEFLEQPLPPAQFAQLLRLSQTYATPIALDESVATVAQLESCYAAGWRGIVVVKAAIAGSPTRLRNFCRTHPIDVVWSSVFETTIARHYIEMRLLPSMPPSTRAIGFGIQQWFAESIGDRLDFEHLWQRL